MDEIRVNCYSGYTYAENPRSFSWRGEEYGVARVKKTWLEPGKRCFQVSTTDERGFELCYHEAQQRWTLAER